MADHYDAIVVGSGPNGLAAAIRLARQGLSVLVVEAADEPGGGTRSASLTLPGYVHDVCSAIHPLAVGSPFLRTLDLERFGLEWVHPRYAAAHPLGEGRAAVLSRSLEETAQGLGRDGDAYERLMRPLVEAWDDFSAEVLQPILHWPRRPMLMARFGVHALRSAEAVAGGRFAEAPARALFAGLAAHSLLRLDAPASAAIAFVLGAAAHAVGWPMPRGGAGSLARALTACLASHGGRIVTGWRVRSLDELPPARAVLLDVGPRQLLDLGGERWPAAYRRALSRFRYGPGIFKIDYALSEPLPWSAAACREAGTVHLGGPLEEVAASEAAVVSGRHPERPFVLLCEQTRFDPSRAVEGGHTLWAYCHVPNGSTVDMTARIEAQIERYAPGFRDVVRARHTMTTAAVERRNPNLVGGDVNGGSAGLWQLLARPILHPVPYRTPLEGIYLCSASTPPGGGVHGMCGYYAAGAALCDVFGLRGERQEA